MKFIKKFLLLYHTTSYLKPVQLFYQLYYRSFPVHSLHPALPAAIVFKPVYFSANKTDLSIAGANNTFQLLNLSHCFGDTIDWNFQSYGKLWNYNLQYFDFLAQDNIATEQKMEWLRLLGESLRNGKLAPEPYPVSVRIINTIHFLSSTDCRDEQVLKDLYAQLQFLFKRPEYHLMANHLLENGFALFMGAYVFNELKWKQKGRKILQTQLTEQILDDGAHVELSPMYHKIMLLRLLQLIQWYGQTEDCDNEFTAFIRRMAGLMISWLTKIEFSNEDIPPVNDTVITASPSRTLLKKIAGLTRVTAFAGHQLNQSGYRKFNVGELECLVDAGPISPYYQPGHSHADALNFIAYYKGRPFITEAGTSTYENNARRNYERSTIAHNTVTIQQQNQSAVWGSFRVGKTRARVRILETGENFIVAQHDGYLKRFGVFHKREFRFYEKQLILVDTVGKIEATFTIHFYPGINLKKSGSIVYLNDVASIHFDKPHHISCETYEFAMDFNRYKTGHKLVVSFNEALKTTITFLA